MMKSPTITSLFACLAIVSSTQADTIFNYQATDSHTSADVSFATAASASGSGPYVDTNNFSDTVALSPSSGYSGPTFYGGYRFSSSTIDKGFTREQIRNAASPSTTDQLYLQSYQAGGWLGSNLSLHGIYIFKQADFTAGHQTGSVALDGLSFQWVGYGNTQGAETFDFVGRLVVQIDNVYYLSQTSISLANYNGNFSISGPTLATEMWTAYDPNASLDFDPGAATFSPLNLEGVTAVGLHFEEDGWAGTDAAGAAYGFGVISFAATGTTVVPEPSSMGAWLGTTMLAAIFSRKLSRQTPTTHVTTDSADSTDRKATDAAKM